MLKAAAWLTEQGGWHGPFALYLSGIPLFLIGLFTVFLDREDLLHPNLRPLLVTGLMGGYTTFSTFEWEIFSRGRSAPSIALIYAVSSVLVGLAACWAGASISRRP